MVQLPTPPSSRTSLSLAATLAALAFAPFADGAVVLSNLSAIPGVNKGAFFVNSSTSGEAVKVTTGAGSAWSVSSVSIITGLFSGSASFQIWTVSGGTLGSLVGTSGALNSPASGTQTFTFSSPVTLTGNTSYWFTPTVTSGSVFWQKNPDATNLTPSAAGWVQTDQIRTTNYTTWSASSGRSAVSLAIDATAVSSGVPDGTSTALILLPGAGLLALRLRRRTSPGG